LPHNDANPRQRGTGKRESGEGTRRRVEEERGQKEGRKGDAAFAVRKLGVVLFRMGKGGKKGSIS